MENQNGDIKKVQDDIKDIQTKYATISSDVKALKKSQTGMQENMNTINTNLENMSKSVEEMVSKLNSIMDEQQRFAVDKMIHKKCGLLSALIKKPMRKLAVGTIGMAMAVGDFTAERMANAKEGLEDIVAEASYNRKIKRQGQPAQA